MRALPDGITPRPPTREDVEEVTALFNTSEVHDGGEVETSVDDIRGEWARPGFDISAEGIAFVDRSGSIVAQGEVYRGRGEATVHPAHRGRGIGSVLLDWLERRTLQQLPRTPARHGQVSIDDAPDAHALFRSRAYEAERTSWTFRLPPDAKVAVGPAPDGVRIRPAHPATELRAVHALLDAAFNEWPGRDPEPYDAWHVTTVDRSDFDPSLLLVAVEGDDETIVGAAVGLLSEREGWVNQVAVRPDRRERGIAQALLRAAFVGMRERGAPRIGLSTDSRTGAKDLYLKVGMRIQQSYTYWSKQLR